MKQKGLAPIVIVLLIAALAVGGYLVYKQQVKPTAPPSVLAPSTNPTSSSTAKTTNWKTYTNAKYGYSIMYPNTWIIYEGDSSSINNLSMGQGSKGGFLYGGQSVIVEVTLLNLTNLEYIKADIAPTSNPLKIGDFTLGGSIGEKWSFNNDSDSDNYAIFFIKNGKRYVIIKELSNKSQFGEYNLEVDQVVSTFKFTN